MHLAGTKKVQQVLAAPGVLERFVTSPEDAASMRRVFAGLYALDGEGAAEAVALGLADPGSYVLKPQREGKGVFLSAVHRRFFSFLFFRRLTKRQHYFSFLFFLGPDVKRRSLAYDMYWMRYI